MQIYRNLARYLALMWYKEFENDPEGVIAAINTDRIDTYGIEVVDILAEFEVRKPRENDELNQRHSQHP